MTHDELKVVRELVDAASPGPWEVGKRCDSAGPTEACSVVMSTPRTSPTGHTWKPAIFKDESYDECHHIVSTADAAFIAASRALVPTLLDDIERLSRPLEISLDGTKLIRWVTPTEYERVMYIDELLEQIADRADRSRLIALLERLGPDAAGHRGSAGSTPAPDTKRERIAPRHIRQVCPQYCESDPHVEVSKDGEVDIVANGQRLRVPFPRNLIEIAWQLQQWHAELKRDAMFVDVTDGTER